MRESAGAGGQRVDGSRRQRLGVLGRESQLRVDRFLDLREGDGHVPDGRVDSCDFNQCAIGDEATQVNGKGRIGSELLSVGDFENQRGAGV